MNFSLLINRIIRALKLEGAFFKEVKADATLTTEAIIVAVVGILAIALGNFLGWLLTPFSTFGVAIGALFIYGIFYAIGFGVFVFLVPLIGNKLFNGKAMTWMEALRPLGYAQAPLIVSILALIPGIRWLFLWIGMVYALVITVFAIKETMELDLGKAIATAVIAWIPAAVLMSISSSILGGIWAAAYF